MRAYRITEASHAEDQWYIAVKRWGLWWTIDVRTGLDRAVAYVKEAKYHDVLTHYLGGARGT